MSIHTLLYRAACACDAEFAGYPAEIVAEAWRQAGDGTDAERRQRVRVMLEFYTAGWNRAEEVR